MSEYIILDSILAEAVKGVYGEFELNPVPIISGDYALPISCRTSKAYPENINAILESLPTSHLLLTDFITEGQIK